MILRARQVYRCQNSECGAEVEVLKASIEGTAKLRCCCGAEMKRPYLAPAFTTRKSTPELLRLFYDESQPSTKSAGSDDR